MTIVSGDRRTAEKRLGLSKSSLSFILNESMRILGVTTVMQAALKLKLLKVNYEVLGEWIESSQIEIKPGITLDLEGDSE